MARWDPTWILSVTKLIVAGQYLSGDLSADMRHLLMPLLLLPCYC